jgi:hypothetical protein
MSRRVTQTQTASSDPSSESSEACIMIIEEEGSHGGLLPRPRGRVPGMENRDYEQRQVSSWLINIHFAMRNFLSTNYLTDREKGHLPASLSYFQHGDPRTIPQDS